MPQNELKKSTKAPLSEAGNLSKSIESLTSKMNDQESQNLAVYALIIAQAANGLVETLVSLSEQLGEHEGKTDGHYAAIISKLQTISDNICIMCGQHEECKKQRELIGTQARNWVIKVKTIAAVVFFIAAALTAFAEFKGRSVFELLKFIWNW